MDCPVCGTKLRLTEKRGIEVDICPDCKGIWLDKGKLEQIMTLHRGENVENRPTPPPPPPAGRQEGNRWESKEGDSTGHPGGQKRRESWFSDILDVFGGD